jgi:CRISPR-associated endonuclease/helicase Cas3
MQEQVYAHSVPGGNRREWETLSDHSAGVAETTGTLAAIALGCEAVGRAVGALHDIGKALPAFQAYLSGSGPSPDHSGAGAVAARRKYGGRLGRVLAFVIAGHHAGLANGARPGGGLTPLNGRLESCPAVPRSAVLDLAPPVEALQELAASIDGDERTPFADQLFVRMLFSCLVDADRLETEAFYARQRVGRGCDLDLATLRDRLIRHMDERFGRVPRSPGPVDAVRADVLDAAIRHAGLAPGLFSLTVPTGGGKTLASLRFALDHALRHGLRRVIYVIPFTSIIEQTADVFRAALGSDDAVLEHHSTYDPGGKIEGRDDEGRDGALKLRLAAQNWDRPIVVTTAVQFFESLFSNRPGRCRKLHNIAKAVVILDEAQTLPLRLLRPCLAAIRGLAEGHGASVVLCTATQPAVLARDGFEGGLEGVREIAPEPERLYRALRRVTVEPLGELDDATLAGRLAEQPQVLCIVNNRRHARDLYGLIRDRPGARLLTTALCAAHRRQILAAIRDDLTQGRPVRLVATSLIEAGVDVDFPVVFRATAGLDSIAQAAGRCNREGRLSDRLGQVFVFDPAPDDNHRPPPELRQFADVAQGVLADHAGDPLSLQAVRAYFRELYWLRGTEELDGVPVGEYRGILNALDETADRLDFPFADIGRAFRVIDSAMVPVIVPFGPARAAIDKLLRDLEFVPLPGGIARQLQPYLVQIPPAARRKLTEAHAAVPIRPKDFGDQFIRLVNEDLYHPDIGLDWDDPTFRRPESTFF